MAKDKAKAPKGDSKAKESKQPAGEASPIVPARLQEKFEKEVIPAMMKRFNYDNINRVPRINKIAINIGVGGAASDPKLLEAAVRDLEAIVGQKVAVTKSTKSISNFKLRENQAIGCKVTLRRARMYEFFDRLMSTAIPRIRDFRGVPDKSFDGRGNYTLGVKEQIIFPEIDVDKVSRITGMDITFVTSATSDEEAYELLKSFGMPFRKREGEAAQ
ncbi:MAG: 50S ribosomal protein L5 [Bacteroidota bacterium]|nr:50S ribosomal protein L5 [Bacteroidota bacterium]MDP4231102.1 50S ribosomal protein L5 [Bacteroidota bacterium]MDP4236870.1 50S ribosomal protein L5 [Bacteroidota bacterium]